MARLGGTGPGTVGALPTPLLRLTTTFAAVIPVKLMSERLGHATAAFTQDVYMHVTPAHEKAAAAQIADLVFGVEESRKPRPS